MPIEAIVTDIELATHKPFRERLFPLQHLLPGLEPNQLIFRLGRPELFRGLIDCL
jgi:hypothetical protein